MFLKFMFESGFVRGFLPPVDIEETPGGVRNVVNVFWPVPLVEPCERMCARLWINHHIKSQ